MTASPRPEELKGKRIGRYTLLHHLDTGGMAEIFLARHEAPGGFRKDLVIKMLQPRYAGNKQVVDMFFDEARLAAKLSHPSIVEVFDVGEDDGMPFIAMEYIDGKMLSDVIRRGIEVGQPMPLPAAVHVISQVADGLAFMWDGRDPDGQRFGIVHRDISPTNILIASSGQTRIIDFGIATDRAARKDDEGGRPGKYSYMAPEQVRGDKVDGRSDIFSLGIILYEITLGKRLYRGPAQTVMKRIVEEPVRPPTFVVRDYPPALELVVLRALEKKPSDRYASADEMAHDLEAFLAEEGGPRVTNRTLALYMDGIARPETAVTERAQRRSRAFIEGDDELPEQDGELDLDRKARQIWRHGNPVDEPTPARDEGVKRDAARDEGAKGGGTRDEGVTSGGAGANPASLATLALGASVGAATTAATEGSRAATADKLSPDARSVVLSTGASTADVTPAGSPDPDVVPGSLTGRSLAVFLIGSVVGALVALAVRAFVR